MTNDPTYVDYLIQSQRFTAAHPEGEKPRFVSRFSSNPYPTSYSNLRYVDERNAEDYADSLRKVNPRIGAMYSVFTVVRVPHQHFR